jgi:hypothetical protein
MITIIITILVIIFALGSISPLLVTDEMHDIVALGP